MVETCKEAAIENHKGFTDVRGEGGADTDTTEDKE